ncbi:MAG: ParB/RepB/Spo0J family partition protein [Armatimonadota bacterium]|nr:ParB/RepB/Spo0J family partition protein [Armatimonadota bacterium]
MERKGLGRGLSTLIGNPLPDDSAARVLQVSVAEIRANTQQPRQEWDDATLAELADSIRLHGVLQPLLIRGRPGSYELVAGERRLRASRLAGLSHVPAILRETDDEGSLRLALIENIQREDISPLDAAQAYQHLIDRFGMSQEEVARTVGKSRPAVANALRLLKLSAPILERLRNRTITEGHARALLAIADPREQERLSLLAAQGSSVREIEAAGRPIRIEQDPARKAELKTNVRHTPQTRPHLEALVERLRQTLKVKVEIRGDEQQGLLCLAYYSEDDLQALADRLLGE